MRQHVPPEQLWNEFHGDLEFEYDHAVYWRSLLDLCAAKQAEHRDRWVKAGKHLGESEVFIRGGDALSVGASLESGLDQPSAKSNGAVPAEAQDRAESNPLVQSERAQANGNKDIAAEVKDSTLTTEGDRP
jgi:hypothetical protein